MKRISILGSTGSIGKSTLAVIDHLPGEFEVVGLACRSNVALLKEQIEKYHPKIVAVREKMGAKLIREAFPNLQVLEGNKGIEELASFDEVECVVVAIVGLDALNPTMKAISSKKTIALANKEVLVSAGELVMRSALTHDVQIIPIDSEHSALFQLLQSHNLKDIHRLILTASGGPFREYTIQQLMEATLEEALNHPTWKMGNKVTIDSSTLMNKGFEVIEAKWLFGLPAEQIEVVVHPQSLVHSFVELVDSTLFAHIHEPNMVHPIQYALTYPKRVPSLLSPFDFSKARRLDFYPPDTVKFPCLELAFHSLREGGSTPCYLNAANEVLVGRLLRGEMSWWEMLKKLSKLMEQYKKESLCSLESVLMIDAIGRQEAKTI